MVEVSPGFLVICALGLVALVWMLIEEQRGKHSDSSVGSSREGMDKDVNRRVTGGLAAAWGVSCGLVSAALLVSGVIRTDAGIAFGLVGLLISFLVLRWSVRKLRTR